jgi:hypothetical protein
MAVSAKPTVVPRYEVIIILKFTRKRNTHGTDPAP